MKLIKVTERIYVDDKGRRVGGEHKGPKFLAHVPGDEVTPERAEQLRLRDKASAPAEKKPEDAAGEKDKGGIVEDAAGEKDKGGIVEAAKGLLKGK